MGVGASLTQIYKNAARWFQLYVDKESFMENFALMDSHNEGGLTFQNFRTFVVRNAEEYGPESVWQLFLNSGPVLMMAHKVAAVHMDKSSSVSASKTVDITEFRALFIHSYVFCVLWMHFCSGAITKRENLTKKLNRMEFCAACRSLNELHMKDHLEEEILLQDFSTADSQFHDTLGFVQICAYCAQYFDSHKALEKDSVSFTGVGLEDAVDNQVPFGSQIAPAKMSTKASRLLGIKHVDCDGSATSDIGELTSGPKQIYAGLSTGEKTEIAMLQMNTRLRTELAHVVRYHEVTQYKHDYPGLPLPDHLSGPVSLKTQQSIKAIRAGSGKARKPVQPDRATYPMMPNPSRQLSKTEVFMRRMSQLIVGRSTAVAPLKPVGSRVGKLDDRTFSDQSLSLADQNGQSVSQ